MGQTCAAKMEKTNVQDSPQSRQKNHQMRSDIIDRIRNRTPEHVKSGVAITMQWNILLANETDALMSGAFEGEYDDIRRDWSEMFYNDLEDFRSIEIVSRSKQKIN